VRVPVVGRPGAWAAGAAAVAVAVLALSGFWAFVTTRAALFALLALSLVVLTGWSGQVSLMPGTFAGVGACAVWVLDTRLGFPLPLAVPLAGVATIPVCAVIGFAALRLRPLYLAVATLAFAALFDETVFRQRWIANGGDQLRVARPSYLAGDHVYAVLVLAVSAVLFAFTAAFARDRVGRAFRMVRDNPRAAESSGVNPVKYSLLAFVLSAFYAGVAGALLAYLLGAFTTAEFSFSVMSLTAFGLAAVGGIRSPLGAVVGAFAFVQLTELFRSSGSVSDWTAVAVGAAIIAVMARNPDGLVGLGQRAAAMVRRPRRPVEDDDVLVAEGALGA
jgi:branched-chain amino acid transport system permease protein